MSSIPKDSTGVPHQVHQYGLRVICATWNVNGNRVGLDSLSPWICPLPNALPPHFVAVSFQEMVDLKDLKQYVNDEDSKNQLTEWADAVVACLTDRFRGISFSIIKRVCLVGTGLVVICQTHLLRYLRDVKKARVATGAFGMIGNKGGCGVRFRLINCGVEEGVSFCFIGMHLAAHQHEVAKRNQDWESVISKLSFTDENNFPLTSDGRKGRTASHGAMPVVGLGEDETGGSVFDHDLVFVMGDLNYRIDAQDQLTVLDLIRRREIHTLLSKDQLTREMKCGRACKGFTEAAEISFPPTYKFQPGTSKYDTRQEKKRRIPAWCDRILVRNQFAERNKSKRSIECERYRACTSLVSSDHKPVAAEFVLPFLNPPAKPQSPRSTLRPAPPPPPLVSRYQSDHDSHYAPISLPLSQFAIALSPFEPRAEEDLRLVPGDRVEVLSVLDDGATVLGMSSDSHKVGMCPASCLKPIGVFESRASKAVMEEAARCLTRRKNRQNSASSAEGIDLMTFPPSDDEEEEVELVLADSGWHRATMDFTARKEDEISFRQGEMIEILSRDSGIEGWWIGRARNFDQGLVPSFCFQARQTHRGNATEASTVEAMTPHSQTPMDLTRSFSFEELVPLANSSSSLSSIRH